MSQKQKAWLVLAGGLALVAAGQRMVRAKADELGIGKVQMMGLNVGAGLAQRVLL